MTGINIAASSPKYYTQYRLEAFLNSCRCEHDGAGMLSGFSTLQKLTSVPNSYQPPHTITPAIIHLISDINEKYLLQAHQVLMAGLIDDAGRYRQGNVGVMKGEKVVDTAPPASRANKLKGDLLGWLAATDQHPSIPSSVFNWTRLSEIYELTIIVVFIYFNAYFTGHYVLGPLTVIQSKAGK